MQGWREEMEDAHLALPDFDPERGLSLFGVFDGHGGEVVAQLVSERLPETLRGLPEYREGRFQEALFKAFMAQDDYLRSPEGRRMLAKRKANAMGMGSTAVVALLNASKRELFVANCGDSRAVLVSGKGAVAMSQDHSPLLPAELQRIRRAGGTVNREGRVDGNLNLSRAIGDLFYKRNRALGPEAQLITAVPEVRRRALGAHDRYLLLGCDGVWERFTNQQVVDFLLPRPPDPGRSAWDWAEELPSHPVLGSDPRLPAGRLSVACSAFLDRAPPSESRVHLCSDPKPLLALGLA
ncbi:unnamed protein product [Effrenium voratum]|nr:unnamed protein product [Effrenium voratum]